MTLREVYKEYGRFKSQAKKLQKWILENFTPEQQYSKFQELVISKDQLELESWLEALDTEVHE